jgi:hypothetical protein
MENESELAAPPDNSLTIQPWEGSPGLPAEPR